LMIALQRQIVREILFQPASSRHAYETFSC
jgi:hypothetical protein